ncbi:MAG: hypothetical protein CR974_03860 [Gammaproteobacteria bacterium]|nr:MAG: hypothetical protein CR974_03860 [Gammaproteobacteria bacterium]
MNKADLTTWKFAFDVVQTAIMLGVSIYVWILSKHKVNATKIAQLEDNHDQEINDIRLQLKAIETTIKHMPDKRSIHNIHERLNGQSEQLNRMEGEMKGVIDNTAMIIKLLAEQGMKK